MASWLLFWVGIMVMATVEATQDPAEGQLVTFMEGTSGPVGVMSTSNGVNVDNSTLNTLNEPILRDETYLEMMTHFVRERIPERVVHAKGTGCFGYFEVTEDISDICKAKVFSEVGKKTPIGVRFSLSSLELGSDDTNRDSRGFAVKFYTEEGNLDLLGFSTPMMFIKDPIFFSHFAHVLKKSPATHLRDWNAVWDLITLHPECLNMFLQIFGDTGVPFGYQYMTGFTIHTFQLVNADGVSHFVKFHFTPDKGVRNMLSADAFSIAGTDPDYFTRSLYNDIANGDYPTWSVGVQVLSMADVKNATFDVFDVTLEWPLETYPLRVFGRFVLNKNPSNFFAEVEQMAFGPGNLVPGILGGPDKFFEARILAYKDAQNYRLGANFNKIKVNKPLTTPFTYNRDGVPNLDENELDIPSYYPNSFNGPQPYIEKNKVKVMEIYEGPPDNFWQISDSYDKLTEEKKTRLIENIVTTLGLTTADLQERATEVISTINADFGCRVWEALQSVTASNTTYSYI